MRYVIEVTPGREQPYCVRATYPTGREHLRTAFYFTASKEEAEKARAALENVAARHRWYAEKGVGL